NSATKLAWFEESGSQTNLGLPAPAAMQSIATGQAPPGDLLAALPNQHCTWDIASVHREGLRRLLHWIKSQRPNDQVRQVTHGDLSLVVRLEHPDRVGLDRLAAAVAANVIRNPLRPAIVVDAGSAITVDLVAADGAFEGGVILPGFRMSAEALYGADLLPL